MRCYSCLPFLRGVLLSQVLWLAVSWPRGAHALSRASVVRAPHSHFVLVISTECWGREENRLKPLARISPIQRSRRTLIIKPSLFVHLYFASFTQKQRKRRIRSAWRGGRNSQNATRIRWDPTPERSGRSWCEGCKEKETGEEERGKIWQFATRLK